MSIIIAGIVKNGVVVPNAPLPEGAQVEIRMSDAPNAEREEARAGALDQFLALARSSPFRSTGAYPTRGDLDERH
jgi:hypothetical protein